MTMNAEGKGAAVSDADLVRYIDGELDAAATARIDAALAGDATLAARLEALRRRTGALHALLARTDPPARRKDPPADLGAGAGTGAPGGGPGHWLVRAAAVILVLAGVVSLVPPLRALVVDGWLRLTASDEAAVQPAQPPPPDLLAVPDTVTAGAIDVRHDTFDFEITARQQSGTLHIRMADVDSATVDIVTRTAREEFLRIPTGVRIISTPASVADYELVLPRRVRLVRVTIGGSLVEEYGTRSERNLERTFDVAR